MDTPEKTQITSSLSKFEFRIRSVYFTSPHVNSHKESRFLKRHSYTNPLKPELSSADGTKASTSEVVGADVHENSDPGVSLGEASLKLPQTLKYDCGSPSSNLTPSVIETNCVSLSTSTSLAIVPFVQEASENGLSDGMEVADTLQIEQKGETIGCEWENLISDASPLSIFNSPNDSEAFRGVIQKSLSVEIDINEVCQTTVGSDECGDRTEGTGELNEMNHVNENFEDASLTNFISGNPSDNAETRMSAPDSFKHGFRRRCLDFEVLAARRKNLDGGSNTNSFVDNKLMPGKPGSDSSGCIVPGIGLHLNALSIASRDNKNMKLETLSSGAQKLSFPSSTMSNIPPTTGHKTAHESLASASSERETDAIENGLQLAEDASQASAYLVNEEFNQISPKKKRRRSEQGGESEACKRCNCKKSKCLKLYCECFAAGVYCIEPCSCQDCFNKPIHEDTVLATRKQIESRNPLAFAPKVISSIPEVGDDLITTPASARHKRGCNCKKSNCLKKYCECFQGGVGCSINCRCEGCKNAFGRKDGYAILETEWEQQQETDPSNNNMDKIFGKPDILNNEQNPASDFSTTPLQPCRPLVQLRRSFSIGSSTAVYTGQRYGKPNIIRPQDVIEKHFQTIAEDEILEILRGDSSPGTDIKTFSPNRKRITPPQCELGSTPDSGRGGRRLILQSIPSFPSLSPKH